MILNFVLYCTKCINLNPVQNKRNHKKNSLFKLSSKLEYTHASGIQKRKNEHLPDYSKNVQVQYACIHLLSHWVELN